MGELDPAPVADAARTLADWPHEQFKLERLSAEERQSVRRFREAEFPYLEGYSAPVLALKRRIRQVAATGLSALLIGETGTGKEAAAFYLHEFSPRRSGPFVALNCAGLEETLLRSELFGHEKGAFTGAVARTEGLVAAAAGGTLFLDELADMPLPVQADLLRFLQTRRFRRLGETAETLADVRLVAAAQPVIRQNMKTGEFRPDLYYRIAEVELPTPALRDIPEDFPRVVRHLVYRWRADAPDRVQDTLNYFMSNSESMMAYPWPGNVRELAALVKRRLLLGDDVAGEIRQALKTGTGGSRFPSPAAAFDTPEPVADMIRRYVQWAFANKGDLTQRELAERLGLSINTVKKYLAT